MTEAAKSTRPFRGLLSRLVMGATAVFGVILLLGAILLAMIVYSHESKRDNASVNLHVEFPCIVELTILSGDEPQTKRFDPVKPNRSWDDTYVYQQHGPFTLQRVRVQRDGKEQIHEVSEQVPTGARMTLDIDEHKVWTEFDYDYHM